MSNTNLPVSVGSARTGVVHSLFFIYSNAFLCSALRVNGSIAFLFVNSFRGADMSVMDVDFRKNLANGEPMSRGGQLLSEIEAEPSTDEGAFRPTLGLRA